MDEQSVLDNTLPKEWSLLELPDPALHTSEFEQIFGASDEENDEFPLSLKVRHTLSGLPLLTLHYCCSIVQGLSGDVGIVGNDPQTSHFLISSIQETLSLDDLGEGGVIPNQSDHPTHAEMEGGISKAVDNFPPTSGTVTDSRANLEEENAEESHVGMGQLSRGGDVASAEESDKEQKKEVITPAVRQSARLRRKRHFDGPQSPHDQTKQRKLSKSQDERDAEKSKETLLRDGSSTKPPPDKPAEEEKVLDGKKETGG